MLDDITKLERLRDNLIATGKVIPANFDPVFKIVMLDCPNYLAFLVSSFTNIPKEKIEEDNCEYCGGLFIRGKHLSCPHCGAAIKAKNE